MQRNIREQIEELLASSTPEGMKEALSLIRQQVEDVGPEQAKPLFEMLSTVFYIDPLDRPDLVPMLSEAISQVVALGKWVIPALVRQLDAGDLKVQMVAAHALGLMGAPTIGPLIEAYSASMEPPRRAFILYALGKVKSDRVIDAVPLALDAGESSNDELRDTAIRALGKFAESLAPPHTSGQVSASMVSVLRRRLSETNPSIRAKAVRSLGKLAKYRHLNGEQLDKLRETLELLLGRADPEWDHAYIVRKEAIEALRYTEEAGAEGSVPA